MASTLSLSIILWPWQEKFHIAYSPRRMTVPLPPLLFLCDHASNAVPPELGTLGLPSEAFATHIAYDIGAGGLAKELAMRFAAPVLLGQWSRLVVDLNRGPDDPTVVMRLSDGRIIPENRDITRDGIMDRIRRYHAPYHAEIEACLDVFRQEDRIPVLISIHSFTPVWRGAKRPWHFGILWDRDERLARPLIDRLARETDVVTGDNEPYDGELENDCLYRHATMHGFPHVLIEVRQDLISDEDGIRSIADRLETVLRGALHAMGPPKLHFSRPLPVPPVFAPDSEGMPMMDEKTRTELEAAAFRRLVAHLRGRADVQNIDLMNLAGFCRNCLGDWYREAAAGKGIALEKDAAREIVYGMPPAEWKKRYQKEASADAQAQFAKGQKTHS